MFDKVKLYQTDLNSLSFFTFRSAYFHFAAATRPKLKAEDPDISITEQAKKIGALWNELSAEEKEPYEKLAEEDKERYNNEMAQYSKK